MLLALLGPSHRALADDPAPDALAQAFLASHCQSCHAEGQDKGRMRLDQLAADFSDRANLERWRRVRVQLERGAMPPADQPRPPAESLRTMLDWIDRRMADAEAKRVASQGRVVLRRLNRVEYQNTLRDLLGVEVDLSDLLPEDVAAGGFDNSAEALHVSPFLLESYLAAADRALDAAIVNGPRPPTLQRRFDIKNEKTVKPTGSVYRHVDDGVAIFSSWVSANIQVTLWQFQTRGRGRYRFRISAHGFQTDRPVTFHVMAGPMNAAAQQYLIDYFSVPPDEPTVVEFVEPMESQLTIRIIADRLGAIPPEVERVGAENYQGPGLVVQWVDIEGPLIDSWPPPSHRQIFGDLKLAPVPGANSSGDRRLEVSSPEPLADAEAILRRFARRAFRRPVGDDELRPLLARVRAELDAGRGFERALRVALRAVLVSPHFLFLHERPGQLDDFALATRLSYFLWSSQPDDELLELAEQGRLGDPETLREQVERLLSDPKAAAFTRNFSGQWLGLRGIDATTPDHQLYPEYDDSLKVSMVKEVLLFFEELLREDLSLTNFVASDFGMLNGRLAEHYGIEGVPPGLQFQRVTLPPGCHRGGVLTMGAVLKVTANGTTTSPVLRGAWVLDRILGTPPPRPTVDVEAVEPDIRGATTIRQQLAKHRERAECAGCHQQIDPPGFALESFDVIGGWRERYRSIGEGQPAVVDGRTMRYRLGPAVDAADALPDGRQFADIDEYKRLLLADKDLLARGLAHKLLAYATGAAPTIADEPELQALVARVRERDYGLRSLVHEVVQSRLFQHK